MQMLRDIEPDRAPLEEAWLTVLMGTKITLKKRVYKAMHDQRHFRSAGCCR